MGRAQPAPLCIAHVQLFSTSFAAKGQRSCSKNASPASKPPSNDLYIIRPRHLPQLPPDTQEALSFTRFRSADTLLWSRQVINQERATKTQESSAGFSPDHGPHSPAVSACRRRATHGRDAALAGHPGRTRSPSPCLQDPSNRVGSDRGQRPPGHKAPGARAPSAQESSIPEPWRP